MKRLVLAFALLSALPVSAGNDAAVKSAVELSTTLIMLGMTSASNTCLEMVFLAEAARERKVAGESKSELLSRLDRDADIDAAVTIGYEIDSIRDDRVRNMFSRCVQQAGKEFMKQ